MVGFIEEIKYFIEDPDLMGAILSDCIESKVKYFTYFRCMADLVKYDMRTVGRKIKYFK